MRDLVCAWAIWHFGSKIYVSEASEVTQWQQSHKVVDFLLKIFLPQGEELSCGQQCPDLLKRYFDNMATLSRSKLFTFENLRCLLKWSICLVNDILGTYKHLQCFFLFIFLILSYFGGQRIWLSLNTFFWNAVLSYLFHHFISPQAKK